MCGCFFAAVTLKLDHDLDILKLHPHTENKVLRSGQVVTGAEKYQNSSQGQRSRSNVTNFQPLLVFTMGHIRTKLHQFLTRGFQDFVWTDRRTDRHHQKQYLLAAGAQVNILPLSL